MNLRRIHFSKKVDLFSSCISLFKFNVQIDWISWNSILSVDMNLRALFYSQEVIQEYLEKRAKRKYPVFKEIDPKCLRWHPPTPVNHNVNASWVSWNFRIISTRFVIIVFFFLINLFYFIFSIWKNACNFAWLRAISQNVGKNLILRFVRETRISHFGTYLLDY